MEVGKGPHHPVHVLPPVVAADGDGVGPTQAVSGQRRGIRRRLRLDQGSLAVVDVTVDAADSRRVVSRQPDRVETRGLTDREQPVRLPHHPEAGEVFAAFVPPGEIPLRKEVRDQIVDDAEAVRLVAAKPAGIEVLFATGVQWEEETGREQHVDPPPSAPSQRRLELPRTIALELLGECRPRQPFVPEEDVAIPGVVEAELPHDALRVRGNAPIAVVLSDAEVDEEGEAVAVRLTTTHAESRLGSAPGGGSASRR